MTLVRWEPARLLTGFFDTPTGAGNGGGARRWIPAMDLVETEKHFVLRADLPGLGEDDVKIELDDRVLTVSGERKAEHEERKEGYYRVERASGTFSRQLTLPEGVDPAAITARFDKGVLEVRVPKPEERKPHRVAIAVEGKESKAVEENAAS